MNLHKHIQSVYNFREFIVLEGSLSLRKRVKC